MMDYIATPRAAMIITIIPITKTIAPAIYNNLFTKLSICRNLATMIKMTPITARISPNSIDAIFTNMNKYNDDIYQRYIN